MLLLTRHVGETGMIGDDVTSQYWESKEMGMGIVGLRIGGQRDIRRRPTVDYLLTEIVHGDTLILAKGQNDEAPCLRQEAFAAGKLRKPMLNPSSAFGRNSCARLRRPL